ncbi:GNAT family N-acetyltransferase [Intrasporangium calvum]|uniref:GNAT family N-acetyltransferase n=1 Tax=Intrasporangium calvum TaxID=53358 RepID=A0ABT5GGQ4_9MICO|nr:GNAT family protein [Intrasporangium calvum]MDC5697015.1 GNAT family N-acetyltransferase [Intrasporangium calvum]
MGHTVADLLPMLGLRISAGPIQLSGITDDDLTQLAAIAKGGIHDPAVMPFAVPWTDVADDDFNQRFAQYHWQTRASFSTEAWELNLAVRFEGALVGVQGFSTKDFLVTQSGETGSWLGRPHQGKGIGTLMRQTMCAFLFDHLGAVEITSGAFTDNPASMAVSRKVGYQPSGIRRLQRRPGELALNQTLVLHPGTFRRGPHPLHVEGLAAFRHSIGLAPTQTATHADPPEEHS